jgi:hypothetical protein
MEFNDDDDWVPNIFVKQFVQVIDDAARFEKFFLLIDLYAFFYEHFYHISSVEARFVGL